MGSVTTQVQTLNTLRTPYTFTAVSTSCPWAVGWAAQHTLQPLYFWQRAQPACR